MQATLCTAPDLRRSVNNKRKDNVMNWFSRLLGGANNPKLTASLIEAAKAGQVEELRNLLAKGVNPNAKQDDGGTAIMWAAGMGRADCVRVLLEKGADANAKHQNGMTALAGDGAVHRAEPRPGGRAEARANATAREARPEQASLWKYGVPRTTQRSHQFAAHFRLPTAPLIMSP